MKCLVCGESFSRQSWSAPAEPCDCGMNFDRETWRDSDISLEALRRRWNNGAPQEADCNQDGTLKDEAVTR